MKERFSKAIFAEVNTSAKIALVGTPLRGLSARRWLRQAC
jgi:hypothetical protein